MVGYIENSRHFVNVIRKYVKQYQRELSNDLVDELIDFYIWSENYTDKWAVGRLTWTLKDNPLLLFEKNFLRKKRLEYKLEYKAVTENEPDNIYHKNFLKEALIRYKIPGVYLLYTKNKELIYIGRSYSLADRVITSIKERRQNKPFFVKFIDCKTKPDACITEAYLIGKHKPFANGDMASLDDVTVEVKNIPSTTKYIKIYK